MFSWLLNWRYFVQTFMGWTILVNVAVFGLGSILAIAIEQWCEVDGYEWNCVTTMMEWRKLLSIVSVALSMLDVRLHFHAAWSVAATLVFLVSTYVVIPRMRKHGLVTQEGEPL